MRGDQMDPRVHTTHSYYRWREVVKWKSWVWGKCRVTSALTGGRNRKIFMLSVEPRDYGKVIRRYKGMAREIKT